MNDIVRPDDAAWLRSNIALFLRLIGDAAACRGCGEPIWWVILKTGNRAPYTAHLLNHFADCPMAETFRKHKEAP